MYVGWISTADILSKERPYEFIFYIILNEWYPRNKADVILNLPDNIHFATRVWYNHYK